MRWFAILLLAGCTAVNQPVLYPSVCMGETTCEARKNAETLAEMGFTDAGLVVLCADTKIRDVLEVECGPTALSYP